MKVNILKNYDRLIQSLYYLFIKIYQWKLWSNSEIIIDIFLFCRTTMAAPSTTQKTINGTTGAGSRYVRFSDVLNIFVCLNWLTYIIELLLKVSYDEDWLFFRFNFPQSYTIKKLISYNFFYDHDNAKNKLKITFEVETINTLNNYLFYQYMYVCFPYSTVWETVVLGLVLRLG